MKTMVNRKSLKTRKTLHVTTMKKKMARARVTSTATKSARKKAAFHQAPNCLKRARIGMILRDKPSRTIGSKA